MRHERSPSTCDIEKACGDGRPTCALYVLTLSIERTDTGDGTSWPEDMDGKDMPEIKKCNSCSDSVNLVQSKEFFGIRAVIVDTPTGRANRCPTLSSIDTHTRDMTHSRKSKT